MAPRKPKWRSPIIIERLTTLGPGMICATAQSSMNSSRVSHWRRSTSSICTTASTPPKPCKASQVKAQNSSASECGRGVVLLGKVTGVANRCLTAVGLDGHAA
jgi:hypothetical protein